MKPLTMIKSGIVCLLCITGAGCMGAPVTFKSLVDQKYDTAKSRTITAGACGFQLLLFIPINTNDRAQRAYSSLMVQAGNDHVKDIKINETWIYAIAGTLYCTELEATAYPLLSTAQTVMKQ